MKNLIRSVAPRLAPLVTWAIPQRFRAGIAQRAIPPLFQTLLKQNHAAHQAFNNNPALLRLKDPDVTQQEYVGVLRVLYGLYAGLEPVLERAIDWHSVGIDFDQRRKLPLLVQDLNHFGINGDDLGAIPVCEDLPPLDSIPRALGCLAIIEGSTAGSTRTAKRLAESNLRLGKNHGTAFMTGYGNRSSAMRISLADAVLSNRIDEEEFLDGGKRTFDVFLRWLEQNTVVEV